MLLSFILDRFFALVVFCCPILLAAVFIFYNINKRQQFTAFKSFPRPTKKQKCKLTRTFSFKAIFFTRDCSRGRFHWNINWQNSKMKIREKWGNNRSMLSTPAHMPIIILFLFDRISAWSQYSIHSRWHIGTSTDTCHISLSIHHGLVIFCVDLRFFPEINNHFFPPIENARAVFLRSFDFRLRHVHVVWNPCHHSFRARGYTHARQFWHAADLWHFTSQRN